MVILNIPKCKISFWVFIERIGNVKCTACSEHNIESQFSRINVLFSKKNPWTERIIEMVLIKWNENHFKLFSIHVITNRKQATLSKYSSQQFDCFSLTKKWTIIFDYDTNQRVCFALWQMIVSWEFVCFSLSITIWYS